MAGVPFEPLDELATPSSFAAARSLLVRPAETADALAAELERELNIARTALLRSSRTILPSYLVYGTGGVKELLAKLLAEGPADGAKPGHRNARAGDRERHLLLYLQRLCAKNDTFSAFGPSAWGTIDAQTRGVVLSPEIGIARRIAFLERWTAHALAAALNGDPEVRAEIAPRLNPLGRLDGENFLLEIKGDKIALDRSELEVIGRSDGAIPAHSLGVDLALLQGMAEKQILRWEVEVPALDPCAFETLRQDIRQWRDNAVRQRWLDAIEPLATLPRAFATTAEAAPRSAIMQEARHRLEELGALRGSTGRALYAATNPIAEETGRAVSFKISETMTEQLARDAEPWIDLWRDTYAFIGSRVAAGLRKFFETSPVQNGSVPLPVFLRHCEALNMPLTGHGVVALAHLAFQEVNGAFREMMSAHADTAECDLSADDCHFIRRNFAYARFDEYTYPSADLQISATSVAAAEQGQYDWIVSELHPPVAMLHHCFYWGCPDVAALSAALMRTTCGKPSAHYGFFAADFTAHTTVRQMEAMRECTYFVAPQRPQRDWKVVAPGEAEVYLDGNNDVCIRERGSKKHLGSFARAWVIPLGFHPFYFGRAPHMPRLRCGRVIVQRESWTISAADIPAGNYHGVSRELVVAIERLRAQKKLPRYVYIRPTEQALGRSGAEGRDKDTKPVFIDLESYLFIEIFYRWLTKSGELEVTEMLPDPDHLLWQEEDGRRTFELRTLIVPRT